MTTTIINAQIFDWQTVLDAPTVVMTARRSALSATSDRSGRKLSIRGSRAATRLIDAHRTSEQFLALAPRFGVTTELHMEGMAQPEEHESLARYPLSSSAELLGLVGSVAQRRWVGGGSGAHPGNACWQKRRTIFCALAATCAVSPWCVGSEENGRLTLD